VLLHSSFPVAGVKCPNCDFEVSPDEVKCPNCGAKIGEEIIERLLPLLKRPSEEPASPLPFYYRLLAGIIKPNIVFSNVATSPDLFGPFIITLLNGFLLTFYFLFIMNNVFFADMFIMLVFRSMSNSLSMEIFFFNFLFAFLELILVSFLYWLPFKLLGRSSSFRSFVSMLGYAYILVVLGEIFTMVTAFGNMILIPTMHPLLQLLVLQLHLYSAWSLGRTVKVVCLLGVAFMLTPAIRKITKFSTSFSLISSYAIIFIAIILLAGI